MIKDENMSNGKASALFARAMLSAVRILTQILRSWLVTTLQRNPRVVLLVLKPLRFQVIVKSAGHVPVYRKQLVRSRAAVGKTSEKCNVI
jgi:hypothetical protein